MQKSASYRVNTCLDRMLAVQNESAADYFGAKSKKPLVEGLYSEMISINEEAEQISDYEEKRTVMAQEVSKLESKTKGASIKFVFNEPNEKIFMYVDGRIYQGQ